MIRWLSIALAAALIAGCSATAGDGPVAVSGPSLTISRSSDLMYVGAPASIDVNGTRVADLGVGQSQAVPIKPGPVVVMASAWSAAGNSTYRFNAESGKSYRVVVTPRVENTIFGAIEGGGPFKVAPAN